MAITIKSFPQASGFVSAHEDVWHVADSTNKAVTGMKYLFDIYKGAELLTRIANSPYGDDQYGILNVGNIVRSSLQTSNIADLNLTTSYTSGLSLITGGADFWWSEYDVRYGEICGTTTIENSASGTYRVYNTYNRHPLHKSGSALNASKGFLTNRPSESNFYIGEPVVLSINGKVETPGYDLQIAINGSSFTSFDAADAMFYFSVNGLTSDSTIVFGSGVVEPFPPVYGTLQLKAKCSKYTPYTLIFLNAYGGWDSFTFVNGNVLTDNEKKKFERSEWVLNGFNMSDRTGKVKYEGMKTYATKFKTKMKLTTDILNTDEYKWLFELIVSPLVYIWDKDAILLHPVQITDTNYEIKDSLKNKAEFLEVNIDIYDQNTQYR